MEFNLRIQEYIELIRAKNTLEAIPYSQKYLAPLEPIDTKRFQQVMGLFAFGSDTTCLPYKVNLLFSLFMVNTNTQIQDFYEPKRWSELIDQFRADNYSLCSLTSHPLLSITLQAGLSALKTPQCYEHENQNVNCPICDNKTLGSLAEKLPLSHHVNSTIVCRISGKIMNEDNQPMLLPNGRVYSLGVSTF